MAKATKTPETYTLTLELNREEAEAVQTILSKVCVSNPLSRASFQVYSALDNAGVVHHPATVQMMLTGGLSIQYTN